ncbi:MAG: ribonuclease P protein component [Acetobacteraceae bacterium]|nr:ribonuclease P protein component [Acetobacteraceae bacterium]
MEREERLRRRRDFREVMSQGRAASNRAAILFTLPGRRGRRVGIAVPRKLGGAVVRNRARRLIREAYRRWRPRLGVDLDLVFLARPGLVGLEFGEVVREVGDLLRRTGAMGRGGEALRPGGEGREGGW